MSEEKLSEALLIASLKKGDTEAYGAIYRKYFAKIYGFALKLTRMEWMAEEITQSVFVKVWTHRTSLTVCGNDANLNGYMFMIARNEVMDYYRSRKNIAVYQSLFVESLRFDARIDESIDASRLAQIVQRIVSMMPDMRRQIFVLSRYKNIPNDDIARQLGISKRTVEKHISLGLQQLRMELSAYMF